MQRLPKQQEEPERGERDEKEPDEKRRSYYYDDAYGYEDYEPDEEPDNAPEKGDGNDRKR